MAAEAVEIAPAKGNRPVDAGGDLSVSSVARKRFKEASALAPLLCRLGRSFRNLGRDAQMVAEIPGSLTALLHFVNQT
jgi:hypothetical protein